jgi:hypothetical protein
MEPSYCSCSQERGTLPEFPRAQILGYIVVCIVKDVVRVLLSSKKKFLRAMAVKIIHLSPIHYLTFCIIKKDKYLRDHISIII